MYRSLNCFVPYLGIGSSILVIANVKFFYIFSSKSCLPFRHTIFWDIYSGIIINPLKNLVRVWLFLEEKNIRTTYLHVFSVFWNFPRFSPSGEAREISKPCKSCANPNVLKKFPLHFLFTFWRLSYSAIWKFWSYFGTKFDIAFTENCSCLVASSHFLLAVDTTKKAYLNSPKVFETGYTTSFERHFMPAQHKFFNRLKLNEMFCFKLVFEKLTGGIIWWGLSPLGVVK